MNEEELFCKLFPEYVVNGKPLSPYFDLFESGYEQAEKVKVVEHFEAYGQCRDSRRIVELEAQLEREKNLNQCLSDHNEQLRDLIKKMKCCYNCKHSRTEYEHCRTDKHEKWEIKENDRRTD